MDRNLYFVLHCNSSTIFRRNVLDAQPIRTSSRFYVKESIDVEVFIPKKKTVLLKALAFILEFASASRADGRLCVFFRKPSIPLSPSFQFLFNFQKLRPPLFLKFGYPEAFFPALFSAQLKREEEEGKRLLRCRKNGSYAKVRANDKFLASMQREVFAKRLHANSCNLARPVLQNREILRVGMWPRTLYHVCDSQREKLRVVLKARLRATICCSSDMWRKLSFFAEL